MARNEDGEFELMLGNKQLLSVFFLMVLLLALCFVGGYWLGRSSAPVLTAQNEPSAPVPSTTPEPAPAPEPTSSSPPPRTAPQVEPEKAPEPVTEPAQSAKLEPAKPEPAKPAPSKEVAKQTAKAASKAEAKAPPVKQNAKQVPGQPVPGRVYLQLSATDKDKADVMVDLLRRKSFASLAAPVAERPGMFRVLVGPIAENAIADTRGKLKAGGFPGDDAIRRVF